MLLFLRVIDRMISIVSLYGVYANYILGERVWLHCWMHNGVLVVLSLLKPWTELTVGHSLLNSSHLLSLQPCAGLKVTL